MSGGAWRRSVVRGAGGFRIRRDGRGRVAFPFVQRRRERVYQVLVYHRTGDDGSPYFPGVPTAIFDRQMELLATSHTVLPLEELIERAGRRDLPPGATAVTFDDGYADLRTHAAPILTRYRIPATIFLTTGPLDGAGPLWHDRVFSAFRRSDGRPILVGGTRFPMSGFDERRRALTAFIRAARRRAPAERDRQFEELCAQMGLDPGETDPPAMLSWDDVRALAREGVRFGAHTVTHPILTTIDREDAAREIRESKRIVEANLGEPIRYFAYPNGARPDFDEDVKRMTREAGFAGAVTTVWGTNDGATDPFELRRVHFWGASPERGLWRLLWYRLNG
ncbi:MAG: polysaccharide deacetylase family protein [Hyphomicrobiales bacterium]